MNNTKTIGIASDHAGYDLKEKLKEYLKTKGYAIEDFGTSSNESCDYPDFAHPLANFVEKNKGIFGISICGSGNGISMTLNKHASIRAALCWNTELSALARQHNDANICSLPARFISDNDAIDIIDTFLDSKFEGGRHAKRVNKIPIL